MSVSVELFSGWIMVTDSSDNRIFIDVNEAFELREKLDEAINKIGVVV